MSALVGIFHNAGAAPDPTLAHQMLRAGGAVSSPQIWTEGSILLGAAKHETQRSSPRELHAAESGVVVVADATLFYTKELRRALPISPRPALVTPAHLIAAAYAVWGESAMQKLEGDFAFALWDGKRRTALLARDFLGTRPLFYAEIGDRLLVASTIAALLIHPECPRELNPVALAQNASGLFAEAGATCYRAIQRLPAGCSLVWCGGTARVWRHWEPPPIAEAAATPFSSAAEELRHLLSRAVEERLSEDGPTSIWLSGGWDSTAVFASGARLLRNEHRERDLRPVSISYPPGDPGREDELIQQVADYWRTPVHWVDIRDIPLLEGAHARAATRDEPFAHGFENWNRALIAASARLGTRVAFSGVGGDHLFYSSPIRFADQLRKAQLHALVWEWSEWRRRGRGGAEFLGWALEPIVPQALLAFAARLRGAPQPRHYLERRVVPWIDPDFARRHELQTRERELAPPRIHRSHAAHELHWSLLYPFGERIMATVHAYGLAEGVEIRSPLFDQRVVRFAASRPVHERASGGETKRLLRRAMHGLLPAEVLRPRPRRTGVTGAYFQRGLRTSYVPLFRDLFRNPLLGQLGIVDPQVLRRCGDAYRRGQAGEWGTTLFLTMQTELWLRTRPEFSK